MSEKPETHENNAENQNSSRTAGYLAKIGVLLGFLAIICHVLLRVSGAPTQNAALISFGVAFIGVLCVAWALAKVGMLELRLEVLAFLLMLGSAAIGTGAMLAGLSDVFGAAIGVAAFLIGAALLLWCDRRA